MDPNAEIRPAGRRRFEVEDLLTQKAGFKPTKGIQKAEGKHKDSKGKGQNLKSKIMKKPTTGSPKPGAQRLDKTQGNV